MTARNRPVIEVADVAGMEAAAAELGPLVPVASAAAILGVTKWAVRDRLRRRSLACVRLFGFRLVPLRELGTPSPLGEGTEVSGSE